ncbi:MAG: M48 family metallopeptidase [Candidatus Aenigmarchaeota archaeon]|nr:M48 family metallopeptidase [Candidatus Aenigmarchaeota archaeon]
MPRIKYPYEFDPKKRRIAKSYRRGKLLFYFLSLLISLVTGLTVLFSGLNITIREFVLQYPLPTLFYGFLILSIFTITGFPVALYSTFVYDHKFKLARYKLSGWFKDYLKGNLISYILSLIMIWFLYFSIRTFSLWWIFAGIFYIIFSLIMNYVYPLIIVPFMWKTEPYTDKAMKQKILNLCRKLGVAKIRNVFVIKESEKTVRPNAFFYGIGNQQKIALFDNLLNDFTKDEVEAVVGHELGHYINKDIIRGLILEAIIVFPAFFIIDYLVGVFAPMLSIQGIGDLASLPLIGMINGALAFLLMPLVNAHSRWRESQADEFALKHVRKPVAQVSLEKRLADLHLAELKVHPLTEFWLLSHPSTIKRIKMAEEWKRKPKK